VSMRSQPIVPPFLRPKKFKIDKPPMTIKQILDLAENRANYRLPVFVHRSTSMDTICIASPSPGS
jgi:hypothetical protein